MSRLAKDQFQADLRLWISAIESKMLPKVEQRKIPIPRVEVRSVEGMARQLKEQGNDFFRRQDYQKALELYNGSLSLHIDPVLYCNKAAALLKLQRWGEGELASSEAIRMDPGNWKAFMRRGVARRNLNLLEAALDDFECCLKLKVDNKECQLMKEEVLRIFQSRNGEKQRHSLSGPQDDGKHIWESQKNRMLSSVRAYHKEDISSTDDIHPMIFDTTVAKIEPVYSIADHKPSNPKNQSVMIQKDRNYIELGPEVNTKRNFNSVEESESSNFTSGNIPHQLDVFHSTLINAIPKTSFEFQQHLQEFKGIQNSNSRSSLFFTYLKRIIGPSSSNVDDHDGSNNNLKDILKSQFTEELLIEIELALLLELEGSSTLQNNSPDYQFCSALLLNLAKVDRFDTIIMFHDNKTNLIEILTHLKQNVKKETFTLLQKLYQIDS